MPYLNFLGPFKLVGSNSIFDAIVKPTNGVYLWCVKIEPCKFRVYYVGEGVDIRKRSLTHYKHSLAGKYTVHALEDLKHNTKVLMHRPSVGMIPRFNHIDRASFNKEFIADLYIFYTEVPLINDAITDKNNRCRFETGIAMHIEDQGQNILHVGHLRTWHGDKENITIDTGPSYIESLSGEIICM